MASGNSPLGGRSDEYFPAAQAASLEKDERFMKELERRKLPTGRGFLR
jgi:hypothetical protein